MKFKNYLLHIALLQTFAFICVVLGHATSIYSPGGWYNHWHIVSGISNLNAFIYSYHMPLFFFISGYLLYKTAQNSPNWLNYNKKRFKRLIIPYYIAGLIYFLPAFWLIHPIPQQITTTVKNYLTLADGGYLWFLITLFCTSLIFTTILKTPLKDKSWLLFSIFIILNLLSSKLNVADLYFKRVLHNLIYFYFGFYLAQNNRLQKIITKPLAILLIFSCSYISFRYHFQPLTAMGFIAAFYGLSVYLCQTKEQLFNNRFIKFIASNMILLYIIHEPIMIGMLKSWNYGATMNPYLGAFLLFILDLLLTINIVYLYRLITDKKK